MSAKDRQRRFICNTVLQNYNDICCDDVQGDQAYVDWLDDVVEFEIDLGTGKVRIPSYEEIYGHPPLIGPEPQPPCYDDPDRLGDCGRKLKHCDLTCPHLKSNQVENTSLSDDDGVPF